MHYIFSYVDCLDNRLILAFIINQELPTTTIDIWLSGNCVKHKAMPYQWQMLSNLA